MNQREDEICKERPGIDNKAKKRQIYDFNLPAGIRVNESVKRYRR